MRRALRAAARAGARRAAARRVGVLRRAVRPVRAHAQPQGVAARGGALGRHASLSRNIKSNRIRSLECGFIQSLLYKKNAIRNYDFGFGGSKTRPLRTYFLLKATRVQPLYRVDTRAAQCVHCLGHWLRRRGEWPEGVFPGAGDTNTTTQSGANNVANVGSAC